MESRGDWKHGAGITCNEGCTSVCSPEDDARPEISPILKISMMVYLPQKQVLV